MSAAAGPAGDAGAVAWSADPAPPGGSGSFAPFEGALEELDGTPIRVSAGREGSRAARPVAPWWRAAVLSARLTARRPGIWVFALLAFLARGGILLLLFPIVVLPTIIGISNLVGPASVTAGGPAPRLVALVAAGLAAAAAGVAAGTLLAAAAEAAFHRATVAPARDGERPAIVFGAVLGPVGLGRGTVRIVGIRLVLLVPVVAVVIAALPAWVEAAYRELLLPGDVTAPLILRVLTGAPVASGLVAVTWLTAEVVGGYAARRAVLLGTGWLRALARGVLDPIRTPVGTILTVAAALGLTAAALAPAIWALAGAWELVRSQIVDEGVTPAAAAGALLLVVAWAAALALAGLAAAWRGCLATAELLRHGRGGSRVA